MGVISIAYETFSALSWFFYFHWRFSDPALLELSFESLYYVIFLIQDIFNFAAALVLMHVYFLPQTIIHFPEFINFIIIESNSLFPLKSLFF